MISEIFIAIFKKLVLIFDAFSDVDHEVLRLEIFLYCAEIRHVEQHQLNILVEHFILHREVFFSLDELNLNLINLLTFVYGLIKEDVSVLGGLFEYLAVLLGFLLQNIIYVRNKHGCRLFAFPKFRHVVFEKRV